MSGKFDGVPDDEYTMVLYRKEYKFDKYDVLYEVWSFDGIIGKSIIFLSEDVVDLSDNEIEKNVIDRLALSQDYSFTVSRSKSGFTFVNFINESDPYAKCSLFSYCCLR